MAAGTRDRIIQVALKLFVEQGVATTPVTAIEAAAGLSAGSGAFYRHFKDKADLLAVVVDHELERVKKVPSAQVSQAPRDMPAREALAIQLRADLEFLAELRPLIHILAWERNRYPEIAARVKERMSDRGIELGIADLLFKAPVAAVAEDPAAAANVMMSAVVGYFLSEEYFGSPAGDVSPERFAKALAALLTEDR